MDIEKETSKTFSIYFNKISFEGLPAGMSAEIQNGFESALDNKVEVTVNGLLKDFENVNPSDIKVEADWEKFM